MRHQLAIALGVLISSEEAAAQPSAFRYRAGAAKSAILLHYKKSNLDGTHPGDIYLFLPSRDRLESLKWSPGDTTATLVKAWIDPTRLTVKRFEAWRLSTGSRERAATLEAVPGTDSVAVALAGNRRATLIRHWPWHSYDFDFAGLGWALPHLVAPEGQVTIGIADVGPTPSGMMMHDLGPVTLSFVRRERRNGRDARRYTIDGPGLNHKGGTLWADVTTGLLAGFEIQQPDEPGMKSGKLVLLGVEPMTEAGWAALQVAKLRGAPK